MTSTWGCEFDTQLPKSNLQKHGLLALTFEDPNAHQSLREDDHIRPIGSEDPSLGMPVGCRLHHADETEEMLQLQHSCTAAQFEWFHSGLRTQRVVVVCLGRTLKGNIVERFTAR